MPLKLHSVMISSCCSLRCSGRCEGLAIVLVRHDRRLSVVFRKHVLRLLALAVAGVTDDWKSHCLVIIVAAEHLLERRGQSLELRLGCKTVFNQFRLDLDNIRVDLQR